jgi:signal transduction histidine kinase
MRGDASQLKALVRNLVDNAIRYTPERGRISVTLQDDPDGRFLFRIADSGPGIPESEYKQVFQRFYRCNAGNQTGTGLGLAIVKNVARQHGASIQLSRSPLGGLCVEVIFPNSAALHALQVDNGNESAL